MPDTLRSETISTRQQTIAKLAQQAPELSFTSLNHHIDMAWLHEAYRRTRKDGAPGVDEQTAAAYAEHLDDNLRDLLDCRSPRALVQVITTTIRPPATLVLWDQMYPRHSECRPSS